jgi:hypothetical protein
LLLHAIKARPEIILESLYLLFPENIKQTISKLDSLIRNLDQTIFFLFASTHVISA